MCWDGEGGGGVSRVARPDVTCMSSEHTGKHESTHSGGPLAVDTGGVIKRGDMINDEDGRAGGEGRRPASIPLSWRTLERLKRADGSRESGLRDLRRSVSVGVELLCDFTALSIRQTNDAVT